LLLNVSFKQVWSFNLPTQDDGPIMKYQSGFNLIELLMVMAIVAIMAMIGIPSFRYVTTSNRVSSEVNSLLGDMQYARNEAVKEGQPVTVCASANPTATPPSCSGSTSWQTGWIVFSDPGSTQTVPNVNPVILRVQPGFTAKDTFVADNPVQAVTFNREGYATAGAIGAVSIVNSVTIRLHDPTSTQWTRCLAINAAPGSSVGMLATEKVGVGNCT
jgi:type IV fimbrial biogenesis protein FimT